MGVTYFKRFRMEYDLKNGIFPAPDIDTIYKSLIWSQESISEEDLLEFHSETKFQSFRFEIDANVFPCLGNRDGCRRLMGEISRRNNFLPSSTLLTYRVDSDGEREYCGTIQAIRDNLGRGSIQNIGVVPAHRGQNLGTHLIHQALTGFKNSGISIATLEVTAQNTKALRLYERLGFQITKTVFKAVEVAFV